VRTYRWAPSDAGDPVELSDSFVAVAASPFFEASAAPADSPSTTAVGSTATTTAGDASAGDGPPGFLYVSQDGRLYEHGTGDESTFGTQLADGFASPRPSSPLGHTIAVEPDGHHAYLTQWREGAGLCEGDVVRVGLPNSPDADVGDAELIIERAADPALSPDGAHLAYIDTRPDSANPDGCVTSLVVRDLESGDEQHWPDPDEPDPYAIADSLPTGPVWLSNDALAVQEHDSTTGVGWIGFHFSSPTEGYLGSGSGVMGEHDTQLLGPSGGGSVVATPCLSGTACATFSTLLARFPPPSGEDDERQPIDATAPQGFVDGVWGEPGLLARSSAACPDVELCAGYDLVWSPIGGDPQPIPLEPKIQSAAWLP
jgi:hypothetical protein